ncbi:MAG: hypothetical protein ACR2G5_15540 [Pyrinomonadaceae bacterium]
MYCSSCGAAVAQDLRYCNHCGAALSGTRVKSASKPSELFPESLIWAMVTVFIVGLGCIIGLMAVMKNYNFDKGLIIAFTSILLLLTLAIEGVFIWMLWGRRSNTEEVVDTARLKQQATKELDAPQARELPEPVPSVTEHTTRAFEPIYSERKSK